MLKFNEKCLYCGKPLEVKNTRKTFCNKKCATYFKRKGAVYIDVPQPKIKTVLVNEFTEERLVIYRFLDKMIDSNPLFIEKLRALCKSPNIQSVNISYSDMVENKVNETRAKTVNEYAQERRDLMLDDKDGYFNWLDRLDADPNLTAKQKALAKTL